MRFKHLLPAFMLLLSALALPNPLPRPQISINGPPGRVIIDAWFIYNFTDRDNPDLYQVRIPLDSLTYNIQELHCYHYNLTVKDVVNHDLYNCAMMRMLYVLYIAGPPCHFMDSWGVQYTITAPKSTDLGRFLDGNEVRRMRTVCCGYDCKYLPAPSSPPAWYLGTGTVIEDPQLNPVNSADNRKLITTDLSVVLDGISSDGAAEVDGHEGAAV